MVELINKWFPVIALSDLLSITGSIYKIYVDQRVWTFLLETITWETFLFLYFWLFLTFIFKSLLQRLSFCNRTIHGKGKRIDLKTFSCIVMMHKVSLQKDFEFCPMLREVPLETYIRTDLFCDDKSFKSKLKVNVSLKQASVCLELCHIPYMVFYMQEKEKSWEKKESKRWDDRIAESDLLPETYVYAMRTLFLKQGFLNVRIFLLEFCLVINIIIK